MTLFGPGSEWFWAAAQFVVVVVSLVGLYRQLRQQNAANALQRIEALQGRWDSAYVIQSRLRVAIWRKHARTGAPTFADQAALGVLCGFFENLSDLEEEGHLSWKEIENSWGPALALWWSLLRPTVEAERARVSPLVYRGFERLALRAIDVSARRGDTWVPTGPEIVAALDAQIGRNTARLQILRDAATGAIPAEPADDAVSPDPGESADGDTRQ